MAGKEVQLIPAKNIENNLQKSSQKYIARDLLDRSSAIGVHLLECRKVHVDFIVRDLVALLGKLLSFYALHHKNMFQTHPVLHQLMNCSIDAP